MLGETLGSYRVVAKIGEGGMGEVYKAQHAVIGREAAVKLLRPELSTNPTVLERFFNEARAAAQIKHPGIVDVLDFGRREDGAAYIVMECLEGESMRQRIFRAGRIDEDSVVRFMRQAASALGAAHEAGIIHRDLKPDNLFLSPDPAVPGGERLKILDFGIAKLAPRVHQNRVRTATGSMMGSPLYMSPEQCKGGASVVDHRSDIYSLGCVMYEMVVGAAPLDGSGVGEIIGKHIYEMPAPPSNRGATLSRALEAVIMRSLQKNPDDRFQSMDELTQALDAASHGRHATAGAVPAGKRHSAGIATAPTQMTPPVTAGDGLSKTTLGSAAAEVTVPPVPMRSRWPFAVLGLFVLAGAGVGIYLATAGGDSDAPAEQAAAAPEHRDERPPAPPAQDPPAPVTVNVAITSEPAGAEVVGAEGDVLGTTPFERDLDSIDGERVLEIRREGFESQTVRVAGDAPASERVELVAVAPVAVEPKSHRTKHRSKRTRPSSRSKPERRTAPKPDRAKPPEKPARKKGDPVDPFAPQ